MGYNTISSLFTGICDAIRYKTKDTSFISHQDIPKKILGINGTTEGFYKYTDDEIQYLNLESVSFDKMTTGQISKKKNVKLLDKLSSKGITSSSTAEQILEAIRPAIEKFCEITGMVVLEEYFSGDTGKSVRILLGFDDSEEQKYAIVLSNNSSYYYRMAIIGTLLSDNIPLREHSYRFYWSETSNRDYANYRSLDIYSYDTYIEYYESNNGDVLFDIYNTSTTYDYKFNQIITTLNNKTDSVKSIVSVGNLTGGSGMWIFKSKDTPHGIVNNMYNGMAYRNRNFTFNTSEKNVFTKENTDVISIDPLHPCTQGEQNNTDDEYVLTPKLKAFTNNFGARSGELLIIDKKKYIVLTNRITSYLYEVTEEENS